jgi:single-strand DNA-binding protein
MNGIQTAFTGRLSRDPASKSTATGKAMLTLSVAVDENSHQPMDRADTETTWVRCVVWEARADELAQVLKKGSRVYIEGRLKLDRWVAQDGQPRAGLNVSAWVVQPMGVGRPVLRAGPSLDAQAERAEAVDAVAADTVEDLPF